MIAKSAWTRLYQAKVKYVVDYIDVETLYYKGDYMNADLLIFTKVINRLTYLTTRDEYGSSRSRGIDGYSSLADELNLIGIHAQKGEWTENSLKLHISRVKRRYPPEIIAEACDLDLINRCSWEYYSGTLHEEIIKKKKYCGPKQKQKCTQSYPLISYEPVDGEMWKEHELDEIASETNKSKKILKKSKRWTPK